VGFRETSVARKSAKEMDSSPLSTDAQVAEIVNRTELERHAMVGVASDLLVAGE